MKLQRALDSQQPPNLQLSDQILNEQGCAFVADFLVDHPQFINIELRGCNINQKGFEKICRSLPLETRTILCEWNAIGNGLGALCDLLINPACQIQLIDLKNNRIQSDICARLVQVLKQNTTLQSINLKWNEIGEKGALYLWEGLQNNRSLKFLDISCNKVPEGIASQIRQKIEQNRSSDMMAKNERNIKESQKMQSTSQFKLNYVTAQEVQTIKQKAQPKQSQATKKNEQIRVAQLKEQIDQELRQNRVVNEELNSRMEKIRQEILQKEQAIGVSRRRHEELLNDKAIIEADYNMVKQKLEELEDDSDLKQNQVMNEYIKKNKFVLGLENDYMRELSSIRYDNKVQIDELHQQWQPRLDQIQHKYNQQLKANEKFNQELVRMKELFLKMRLDHDENIKSLEARLLIEERAKYDHQLEIMKKKEIEVHQQLGKENLKGNSLQDDINRLEGNINRDRNEIEQQIQIQRDDAHQNHLKISKRSIKIEKLINQNIVQDAHIVKLESKIKELYHILNIERDFIIEDNQKRRQQHEQEYLIHKQNQSIAHQRVLDLELLIRNQESENTKIKTEYERMCHLLQQRLSNTINDSCRSNIQIN